MLQVALTYYFAQSGWEGHHKRNTAIIVEVLMDSKKARAYILDTTAIQNGKTLEKHLKHMRNTGIWAVVFLLFLLGVGTFHANNASIEWVIIFLTTLFSAVITGVIAIKRHKHLVQTHATSGDSHNTPRMATYNAAYGTLSVVIAFTLI